MQKMGVSGFLGGLSQKICYKRCAIDSCTETIFTQVTCFLLLKRQTANESVGDALNSLTLSKILTRYLEDINSVRTQIAEISLAPSRSQTQAISHVYVANMPIIICSFFDIYILSSTSSETVVGDKGRCRTSIRRQSLYLLAKCNTRPMTTYDVAWIKVG